MRWSPSFVVVLCFGCGLHGCTFDATGLGTSDTSTKVDAKVDGARDQRVDGSGDLTKKSDHGPDIYDPTDLAITPPDTSQDAGGLLFVPSNLSGSFWALGQTDFILGGKVVVDTTTGKLTSGSLPTGVGLYCTKEYCIITAKKVALNKGSELQIVGKRPLVVVATDDISVDGAIIAAAFGLNAGPGGALGGASSSAGQGCGGGYKADSKRQGGAGGSFGGYGGKGGGGPAGKAPCVNACVVGYCPAIKCLTPLQGGSGGAGGGDGEGLFAGDGGRGGAGGGAVQLSSLKNIAIKKNGSINVGGGGAQGGGSSMGGGGGGGSGGGILLEAAAITIDGTLAANGGSGGGGAVIVKGGSPGSPGAASATAASGGGGGSVWPDKGGNGGNGSSKASHNGDDGNKGSGISYAHGGGGGSAGRICLRTTTGTVTFGASALISPSSPQNSEAYNLLTLP